MSSALEKMQAAYKKNQSGNKDYYSLKQGWNRFRVCPSWLGKDELFYKEIPTHYNLGPERRLATCCVERCPACLKAAKLAESSNPKKQKRAENIMVKTRIGMNVVPYDKKGKLRKKPKMWTTTPNNLNELLQYVMDADYGDFTDVKKGFDVMVHKKGKKKATRYKVRLARKPSKFKTWKKIKKHLYNLDKRFKATPRGK